MTARQPRVVIVIDEVVLRGVAPERARAVAAGLASRLTQLGETWAAGDEAAPTAREEAFRRAPAIDAPANSASVLGAALAGSVWHGLAGGRR